MRCIVLCCPFNSEHSIAHFKHPKNSTPENIYQLKWNGGTLGCWFFWSMYCSPASSQVGNPLCCSAIGVFSVHGTGWQEHSGGWALQCAAVLQALYRTPTRSLSPSYFRSALSSHHLSPLFSISFHFPFTSPSSPIFFLFILIIPSISVFPPSLTFYPILVLTLSTHFPGVCDEVPWSWLLAMHNCTVLSSPPARNCIFQGDTSSRRECSP